MRLPIKEKAGFTLIELVVTLAVMAVVLSFAISMPAERRQVRAAALQLQSDLRYAQRIALTEGRRVVIILDQSRNIYHIEKFTESKRYERIKTETLNPYINMLDTNASGSRIEYTPRGTRAGNACTINL